MLKIIILILSFLFINSAYAQDYPFEVRIEGSGSPIILIPGLASSGDVWNGTVEQLKDKHQLHILTLKGFAGVQPIDTPDLKGVKDGVIRYIKDNNLNKPDIIGHSIGGFLSMWIASSAPDITGKIIVVDALPFLSGVVNPALTAKDAIPQAESIMKGVIALSEKDFSETQRATSYGMTLDSAQADIIYNWSLTSDRKTIAKYMYDMLVTDLRDSIKNIKLPVLVLGSWSAAKMYGGTKESTSRIFIAQYEKLEGTKIILAESAKHFIMYDEPEWFYTEVKNFLEN